MSKHVEKKPKSTDKGKSQSDYQSEKSTHQEKPAMTAKPGKKK